MLLTSDSLQPFVLPALPWSFSCKARELSSTRLPPLHGSPLGQVMRHEPFHNSFKVTKVLQRALPCFLPGSADQLKRSMVKSVASPQKGHVLGFAACARTQAYLFTPVLDAFSFVAALFVIKPALSLCKFLLCVTCKKTISVLQLLLELDSLSISAGLAAVLRVFRRANLPEHISSLLFLGK